MTSHLNLSRFDPSQLRVARQVATRLREAGHVGLIVGGAVRDLLIGRSPKDVDMVTDARPDQVEALFERTLGVGRAFGIMVVLLDDQEVELATFRVDGSYSDGRHPDAVTYGTTPEEDAARRDFTCNALFLDPESGQVLDPVGGRDDIVGKRLDTVGDASRRFAEDGLRLLRMVRFEAQLGFRSASGLHAAAREAADKLEGVSPERILEELLRTFREPSPERALRTLAECDLLERILPGLAEDADARGFALKALGHGAEDPVESAATALAIVIEPQPFEAWDSASAEAAEASARSLKPSRQLLRHLLSLWELRREMPQLVGANVDPARRARALREPASPGALRLARAWASARGETQLVAELEGLAGWLEEHRELLEPKPWLTARDLIAAGVPQGPQLGEVLRELETAQLRGELESVAAAREWLSLRGGEGAAQ
ncbi:MAG: tRNA nucleotidyltransferase/poly(A) polymerase [Planctomycetota bacterium]|jgi:tRNA nucleotidyltransferase/poly(A) polymerase